MKIYIVIKSNGEYEDSLDEIHSAYTTKEAAEKAVNILKNKKNKLWPIPQEQFEELLCEADYKCLNDEIFFDNFIDEILFLHPEWKGTDKEEKLRKCELLYMNHEFNITYYITETELFDGNNNK